MMNSRLRDLMGVAAIIGIVFFAYVAWVYVSSYAKSIGPGSFRSFSVSAQGESIAIPDIAQFSFSVITQGGVNIASLQKENAEKANNAIAFVKREGVEEKDIKTQQFSLEPRYQSFSCPRPLGGESAVCPPAEIAGYTISQTVQVKARDFAKVGAIVSGVVENGANSVSQLFFTVDSPDMLESEARAQAIQKAKEKAEAVARAGGFRLGRLLAIQEGGFPYLPMAERANFGFGGEVSSSAQTPVIEPGSQEITVFITLTYEIQ